MNLDALCANYGNQIVQQAVQSKKYQHGRIPKGDRSKIESIITKSLGVLQEDGVYAFFLFLRSCKGSQQGIEEVTAGEIESQIKELLRNNDLSLMGKTGDDFKDIRDMTESLDSLLLARQLIERSLVYARYHAKALNKIDKKQEEAAKS